MTQAGCTVDATRRDKGRGRNKPRPAEKSIPPHLVKVRGICDWIVEELLDDGAHTFAAIREEFSRACERLRVATVSDRMLATWLTEAGLVRRRVGHAKTTTYTKLRRDNSGGEICNS